MIIGFFLGMAAHSTNYIIDRWQSAKQWKLITRYAVGSLVVAAVYWFQNKNKHGADEANDRLQALLAANVAVGAGVAAGWIAEDTYKDYKL